MSFVHDGQHEDDLRRARPHHRTAHEPLGCIQHTRSKRGDRSCRTEICYSFGRKHRQRGQTMATFILVHGTFARAADWPALRDGLTVAASAVGERSQFVELKWSGKNRASARQVAASEIFSVVQHIQSSSSHDKIFIIGHSHGGSAIAYFLKEYSSLAKAQRLRVSIDAVRCYSAKAASLSHTPITVLFNSLAPWCILD